MTKFLTVRSIGAIKPRSTRFETPDGKTSGLWLITQPSGAKSWAYRYRSPVDGKSRKRTIGPYPALGLADARQAAEAGARAVALGDDPIDQDKATRAKASDTSDLVTVLLDGFIQRHIDAKNRPSTAAEAKRLIEKEIRPVWGPRKIDTLTRRDVRGLLDKLIARGATVSANRLLALVRKFLNWCIDRDVLMSSPAAGVEMPAEEVSRDRILDDYEIRWFWLATEEPEPFSAAFRLMLLTAQRRGEVAAMTFPELQLLDDPVWLIPGAKTKNGRGQAVPLSDLSVETINALPRIERATLVLTHDGRTPISGWSKAKAQLDARMIAIARKEADERGDDPSSVVLTPWRLHDLRRTAASGMARLGQPIHVVEAVLNHRGGTISGVAAVYNRYDYLDEKRRALAVWADYVSENVGVERATRVFYITAAR